MLCAVAFGAIGCGALNDMEDMKKTTEEMQKLTGEMRENMDKVVQLNCNTYGDLRQKGSLDSRRNNLSDLTENTEMAPKVAAAVKYLQSFEFQVLKDSDLICDNEQADQIMADGVTEFFLEFLRFFELRDAEETDVDPAERPARFKNMFALALAIQYKNINQYSDAPKKKGETVSLMDLIYRGLSTVNAVEKEEVKFADLPKWSQQVLQNQDIAVYLFQLRLNFQLGLLINQITKIESYGFFKKVWFDRWLNTGNRTWDPQFHKMTIGELERVVEFASGALETRAAIQSFAIPGVAAKVDSRMRRYLSHMEKYRYKEKANKQELINHVHDLVQSLLNGPLPDKGDRL